MFYCQVYKMVWKVWLKENLCGRVQMDYRKETNRPLFVPNDQNIFFPYISTYRIRTKEINFPDQTNKNGERVLLFVLVIKIRKNRLKSRKFVSIMTTLFKVLCRNFRVKKASISYFSIPQVHPLNSIESIEFDGDSVPQNVSPNNEHQCE